MRKYIHKNMWTDEMIEKEFTEWRTTGKTDAEAWRAVVYLLRDNYEANMRQMQPIPIQEREATIVCLCGSTRFYEAFVEANFRETMAGKIVLSVGFFMHRPEMVQIHSETVGITPDEKVMLDELHMRKIDLADEVLILNVNGYIGESTARELTYAQAIGKHVSFLEPPMPDRKSNQK